MKLSEGNCHTVYTIMDLNVSMQIKDRLQSLGMIRSSHIEVIQKKRNGTMIINIRGTRFALGAGLTKEIEVIPCQKK